MPSANPTTVQTENNNFVALTNALLANTADMVGTESKAQLLLKFRFAMHLLTFVNEDSRLLILKLASIVAGLRCSPTPCLSSRFNLQRNCRFVLIPPLQRTALSQHILRRSDGARFSRCGWAPGARSNEQQRAA